MILQVPADFTLQDLRRYLAGDEDAQPPEGYQTAVEWARQLDCHLYTMYKLLREAQYRGLLLKQPGRLERIDGKLTTIMFYAFAGNEHEHNYEGGAESGDALRDD